MPSQTPRPIWQLPILVLTLAALVFAALRIALRAAYPHYFADTQLPAALLAGARFDLKLIVIALAPCLLLWLLPMRRARVATAWLAFALLIALLGLGIADLAYFGEVSRHIGSDLLNIGGDIGSIIGIAFGSRLVYTLAALAAFAALAYLWQRSVIRIARAPIQGSLKTQIPQSLALLLGYVFLARGMVLTGKPLGNIDAFNGNGQSQANLTLNGSLVTLQALNDRRAAAPLRYLDDATAQRIAAAHPHPFRYQTSNPPSRKNVVIILLESWSYKYIDALSGNNYRATPYMDALIAKSQVWTNFYAAGQRSIIGIQASLTSVPALPNRQPIGFGLELNNMSRIAELAQKQGYRTLMLQTSNRRSFHIDGVAQAIGFQEYYGKEDVPIIRQYPQDPPPFGWDYDSLMYFGKQISSKPEPFFAFFFSGTTHEPYARTGKEFDIRPHAETGENGFLNTLQYSDWSVAQFMQYAAQQPWHNNTIYIFMADHTRNEPVRSDSVREQYHIPLIVYHPQWQPEKHSELASQYDILPTLADWLGIQQPVYTFGRSLANRQTRANELPLMLNHGDDAYILSPNGIAPLAPGSLKTNAMSVGEAKTLDSNDSSAWQQDLQYEQWRIQTADQKLRHNQWAQ